MGEQTIIRTMPTPPDRDWVWHADLNVVVLSDRLNRYGRARALIELQLWWRRQALASAEPIQPACAGLVCADKLVSA